MTRIVLFILRAYQFALAPLLGNQCRFAPTCSQYALEAVERFGAWRGTLLALGRLLRCQPWHAGGWDPVPSRQHWGADQCGACAALANGAPQGRRLPSADTGHQNTNL